MQIFSNMPMKSTYKLIFLFSLNLFSLEIQADNKISLTPEEQRYIQDNPVITYSVEPHNYPIESINASGIHTGLTRNYINLLSEITGIKFQLVPSENYVESYSNLKSGKVKLLTSTSEDYPKANGLISTIPFFSAWPTMVKRSKSTYLYTPDDINEGYVSISDNLSLINWFKEQYPNITYKIMKSPATAIESVAKGNAAAAIVLAPHATYNVNLLYQGVLKISRPSGKKIPLVMSTKPEDKILVDILNKVITSISAQKQNDLASKWIIPIDDVKKNNELIKLISFSALFILFIMLIYTIRNIRKLKSELHSIADKNTLEISVMSHELRTPLIGILTACEDLSNKISVTAHKDRLLNVIHVTKSLLDNLDLSLDYAKINAKQVQTNPHPHNLSDICDTTVKLFASFAEKHKTKIKVSYLSPEFFMPHLIDSQLISQALNNIVNNAIKHTRSGIVLIECSVVRVDDRDKFSIEITDTGVGIPAETLEKLSEPYYQGQQPTSNESENYIPKGTGLGLFVAKKNIHLIGGNLVIFSKQGIGSRVKIVFPIMPAHYAIQERFPNHLLIIMPEGTAQADIDDIKDLLNPWGVVPRVQSFSTVTEEHALFMQPNFNNTLWILSNRNNEQRKLSNAPIYASEFFQAILSLTNSHRDENQITPVTNTKDCVKLPLPEGTRLLIVEDEPLLRAVQSEMFTSMGFIVDAAADAQSAYKSWIQYQHPMIITDCRLDNSDGFELVLHLRKLMQNNSESVLIIGQSASLKDDDYMRAKEVGMNHIMRKPVSVKTWHSLIIEHFGNRSA
ncbi:ATP-binding protein [Yersinia ruckeri]|uniref:histidine kinase n=3 Tax=Yersinia ruckeri TaxID=29486 RepID=A0A380QNE6_YERRU|nr:ATP-binding protein [Yersinia ruckeri]KGA50059.1 bacterial extracellular solute-binding s, 3 family protein [Yersinia ruckeri ATCC 29473]MCK8596592.1 response regulator [Yersinia ruckeri]MCK8599922.1 response regulator [Yersinia ruckeri]MCW6612295.1 ATP-binding protein [Yersinia ruckeri]MCW6619034.1 ATP-binding protein [Yersinia ruckeri]